MTKAGTSREAAAARRELFVEAYIANGGNATAAARACGYTAKSAATRGCELVKDRKVAALIAKRREKLQEAHGLTTERVLKQLARIVYADPRKYFDDKGKLKGVHELDEDAAAALSSIEVGILGVSKVKLLDKVSGIEKAMRHLGLFEQDNRQSQPVTIVATKHDERL